MNAFDVALMEAGVSEQNLVAVSSVLPEGIVKTEKKPLTMGAVTHCVLSQMRGYGGERISSGIAYTFRTDGMGGYVAEGHIHGSKEALEKELGDKMKEMSRMRGKEFGEVHCIMESQVVPKGEFGCCMAALVFSEYR